MNFNYFKVASGMKAGEISEICEDHPALTNEQEEVGSDTVQGVYNYLLLKLFNIIMLFIIVDYVR